MQQMTQYAEHSIKQQQEFHHQAHVNCHMSQQGQQQAQVSRSSTHEVIGMKFYIGLSPQMKVTTGLTCFCISGWQLAFW